jgi:nitroreductase
VKRILEHARQAPSGGNLQPWHVHALTGKALQDLITAVAISAAEHPGGEQSEYEVYPAALPEPYRSRRYQCGEDLYASIGIERADRPARLRQFARNLTGFGAPVVLFFCIERYMGKNQWAHLGMLMQTIMLLAQEEGLHTCPQEAWSPFNLTISQYLRLPSEQMLYCGMAMGFADLDQPINQWRTQRAELSEWVEFKGFKEVQETA